MCEIARSQAALMAKFAKFRRTKFREFCHESSLAARYFAHNSRSALYDTKIQNAEKAKTRASVSACACVRRARVRVRVCAHARAHPRSRVCACPRACACCVCVCVCGCVCLFVCMYVCVGAYICVAKSCVGRGGYVMSGL